jgi:hypothetical protein
MKYKHLKALLKAAETKGGIENDSPVSINIFGTLSLVARREYGAVELEINFDEGTLEEMSERGLLEKADLDG